MTAISSVSIQIYPITPYLDNGSSYNHPNSQGGRYKYGEDEYGSEVIACGSGKNVAAVATALFIGIAQGLE